MQCAACRKVIGPWWTYSLPSSSPLWRGEAEVLYSSPRARGKILTTRLSPGFYPLIGDFIPDDSSMAGGIELLQIAHGIRSQGKAGQGFQAKPLPFSGGEGIHRIDDAGLDEFGAFAGASDQPSGQGRMQIDS